MAAYDHHVYPTAEELSKVSKTSICPECSATFQSDSNLTLHLAKTHKKPHLLTTTTSNKVYHCPVTECGYHTRAHFKQLRCLKQHYLKVHSERRYVCCGCHQGFATEAFRNRHAEYCNVTFKCCDCDAFYACYETLRTHSRRKRHHILEKHAYKLGHELSGTHYYLLGSNNVRFILPKGAEQGSQTEQGHSTQETQTQLTQGHTLNVETQTDDTCCESSTQTATNEEEYCSSTYTDTSDLLTFDTSFFNMETQTDLMFPDELLRYCDDYANMCTQTCEDLFLGEMGLGSKTGLDENMLKSVESQTVVSHYQHQRALSCTSEDMNHTQTQTDFKQMLEEINA